MAKLFGEILVEADKLTTENLQRALRVQQEGDPHRPAPPPNAYQGVLNFNTNDEVLSYVSRNLEPVRGFQVFMRTLPAAPRRRPTLTRAC